jgi:glycosyltransferase involved in cell wall biosynthesis
MKLKDAHILLVIGVLTGGGAERAVSVLSSAMADMGYHITIMLYKHRENEYPLSDAVRVCAISDHVSSSQKGAVKIKKMLCGYRLIKELSPDIIIPFLFNAQLPVFIVNLLLRRKLLSTIRNHPRAETLFVRMVRDAIVALSTACFVQTDEQKRYFSRRTQRKTFVVPNPVGETFLSIPPHSSRRTKTIVTAGRLVDQKNQQLLIKAVKALREEFPDVKLKIYGEGTNERELQQLIHELNLNDCVSLEGRCVDMPRAYADADFFALVSNYEGMPNALMEAMACELPCISTDCPTGPKDLITHGVNGVLIPMHDLDALVAELQKMMQDRNYADELGRQARSAIVERHSAHAIATLFCEKLREYCSYE